MYKRAQIFTAFLCHLHLLAQTASLNCAPSVPIATPGDTIRLHAWATPLDAGKSVYAWTVSSGEVLPSGANVFTWKLTAASTGPNTADGELRIGSKVQARCLVEIQVAQWPTPANDSGLLLPDTPEPEGAGLYNYLLISSPANQPLTASALSSWLALNAPIADLRTILKPTESIVLSLPVLEKPSVAPSAEWTLKHYDFPHARTLLEKAFPGSKPGIYIVSSLQPLSKSRPPYLIQDLSAATPSLVSQWVEAFINEAAQERSWTSPSVASLVDQLRSTLLALDPNLRLPLLMKWIALL
jgi:hypothetical protein